MDRRLMQEPGTLISRYPFNRLDIGDRVFSEYYGFGNVVYTYILGLCVIRFDKFNPQLRASYTWIDGKHVELVPKGYGLWGTNDTRFENDRDAQVMFVPDKFCEFCIRFVPATMCMVCIRFDQYIVERIAQIKSWFMSKEQRQQRQALIIEEMMKCLRKVENDGSDKSSDFGIPAHRSAEPCRSARVE